MTVKFLPGQIYEVLQDVQLYTDEEVEKLKGAKPKYVAGSGDLIMVVSKPYFSRKVHKSGSLWCVKVLAKEQVVNLTCFNSDPDVNYGLKNFLKEASFILRLKIPSANETHHQENK